MLRRQDSGNAEAVNTPNDSGDTALLAVSATAFPSVQVIRLLIDAGADMEEPDVRGLSPLLRCIT